MNRVAIVIDENMNLKDAASDEPIELYWIDDGCPTDRVYRISDGFVEVGKVDEKINGDPVGHSEDGILEAALSDPKHFKARAAQQRRSMIKAVED